MNTIARRIAVFKRIHSVLDHNIYSQIDDNIIHMDIKARGERFNELLGLELKAVIASRGETLSGLAGKLDTYHAQMSLYVNGKRKIPVTFLNGVCELIQVKASEIVDRAYERLIEEQGIYDPGTDIPVSSEPDLTKLNLAAKETNYDPWDDVEGGEEQP